MLGPFTKEDLLERLLMLPVLILSLSVHEWAHAWSAYKLGDDTAAREGRLTLNPLAHIDPIGTILLPLLRIPFGWAKPVPVNPLRFRREVTMKAGMMITAAAGPLSNVFLALVSTVLMGVLGRVGMLHVAGNGLAMFLRTFVLMNVGLAVFNFLPIPPLDGSRIVDGLMPLRLRPQWEAFMRYGSFLLLAMIMFGFGRGLITKPIIFLTVRLDLLRALIAGY